MPGRRSRVRGLAVFELGEPGAPAIVVAHGVGSSGRFVLDTFGAPVVASGRRLVTYDLRGHGDSDPASDVGQHALPSQVDDLRSVAEHAGASEVAGVSLGGHAAVALASTGFEVDAVGACLPAWTGSSRPGEGPHAAIAEEARTVGIPTVIERLAGDRDMLPWLREVVVRDYSRHDPDSLAAALIALDGADAPTANDLRHLTAPLAVVAWPGDPGHPLEVARSWAQLAPRGRLVETTLAAMEEDRTALGRALVTALDPGAT